MARGVKETVIAFLLALFLLLGSDPDLKYTSGVIDSFNGFMNKTFFSEKFNKKYEKVSKKDFITWRPDLAKYMSIHPQVKVDEKNYFNYIFNVAPYARVSPRTFIFEPEHTKEQLETIEQDSILNFYYKKLEYFRGNEKQASSLVKEILRKIKDKEKRQLLFLPNDYFFSNNISLSKAMWKHISIVTLFLDNPPYIKRGDKLIELKKKYGIYCVDQDISPSRKVYLQLNDKVSDNLEKLSREKFNLEILLDKTYTEKIPFLELDTIKQIGRAKLIYATKETLDYIFAYNKDFNDLYFVLEDAEKNKFEKIKEKNRIFWNFKNKVQSSIDAMVSEKLFFDEPAREEGQEDGLLRLLWKNRYFAGGHYYTLHDTTYCVFSIDGIPMVPQLCSDFIMDVWERSSGAWWLKRNEGRKKTEGTIDIPVRGSYGLINYCKKNDEMFEIIDIPKERRVPYYKKKEFFNNLIKSKKSFSVGDVFIVYGWIPQGRMARHSYMVYETDPVTGFPLIFAENPSYAKLNSWNEIMRRSSTRKIHHIFNIKPEWIIENF